MKIVICRRPDQATFLAAHVMTDVLGRDRQKAVLGLATGRTMEAIYAHLIERFRAGMLDFSRCTTFNLDEYVGIPPEDRHSYRYYMNKHLFSHVNIDVTRTHVPDGMAPDLDHAAKLYDQAINEAGTMDLQLLGIGENGHIGFNEPYSSLASRTRVVTLDPHTREQNSGLFDDGTQQVPTRAVTMGVGTILQARRTLLVATGSAKADIVASAIEGPVTASVTASALQLHPDCLVLLDEHAAHKLTRRDYIEQMRHHDPEIIHLLAQLG